MNRLTPFDIKFITAQTPEHSVFSVNGHAWVIGNDGQTRHCVKCWKSQCSPPYWVPIPNGTFSTEDIEYRIETQTRNEVKPCPSTATNADKSTEAQPATEMKSDRVSNSPETFKPESGDTLTFEKFEALHQAYWWWDKHAAKRGFDAAIASMTAEIERWKQSNELCRADNSGLKHRIDQDIAEIEQLRKERDAYEKGCESAKRGENEWHSKWELNQTEKINLRIANEQLVKDKERLIDALNKIATGKTCCDSFENPCNKIATTALNPEPKD